jgi:hypothetical protein
MLKCIVIDDEELNSKKKLIGDLAEWTGSAGLKITLQERTGVLDIRKLKELILNCCGR